MFDPVERAIEIIRRRPNVTEVSIRGKGIYLFDKEPIEKLVTVLNENPQIKSLNLHRDNISNEGAMLLAGLKHVEYLILSHNDIHDQQGCEHIKALLEKGFRGLDLSGNWLSPATQEMFSQYPATRVTYAQAEIFSAKNPAAQQSTRTSYFFSQTDSTVRTESPPVPCKTPEIECHS